jgi:hypothetical protein
LASFGRYNAVVLPTTYPDATYDAAGEPLEVTVAVYVPVASTMVVPLVIVPPAVPSKGRYSVGDGTVA